MAVFIYIKMHLKEKFGICRHAVCLFAFLASVRFRLTLLSCLCCVFVSKQKSVSLT